MSGRQAVRVWGPGSISNLGPGFDTLGLCVADIGDIVEVSRVDQPGVTVLPGTGVWDSPTDPLRNTAAVAAASVLRRQQADFGLAVRIHKGLWPGSGLGSSAASAVAAAWAAGLVVSSSVDRSDAVQAALEGEAVASGALHGDNVLPALMGGLVLVSSTEPTIYRLLPVDADSFHLAIIRPDIEILTQAARERLPESVSLADAVHNASALAFMIDAFRAGDLETIGRCMMSDRLVEPVRATLLPPYDQIRSAAMEAGASGVALSGSGPAMFALCDATTTAERVRSAMVSAAAMPSRSIVTRMDREGARIHTAATLPTPL